MNMRGPEKLIHVIQGETRISDTAGEVLSTILGSCVAACMHDPRLRIGGINHFLLPGNDPRAAANVRYGAHAMEELVNGLIRRGASRDRIQVQLFGGATIVANLGDIGSANGSFARTYVREEGLSLVGEDLGGSQGRRLRFDPITGKAQVQAMTGMAPQVRTPLPPRPEAGTVELF